MGRQVGVPLKKKRVVLLARSQKVNHHYQDVGQRVDGRRLGSALPMDMGLVPRQAVLAASLIYLP